MNLSTLNSKYADKWLAFTGIALLSFGPYLDYTVVNIALPTIQQALKTNLLSLQWVMNIYFLALCILATIMGRFGDLYGRRRCFYIGTVIFAVASLIAGFSSSIHWLILGRLLQGVGAALVFPLGPSLLPQAFPEQEQSKAIAWLGSLGGVALALGPILGGFIVTYWGWRWIFFINIPIILLGYLFSLKTVKESPKAKEHPALDIKGMLLLALTLSGIVLSLISSQSSGWLQVNTMIYLVVGLLALGLLIKVEKKQHAPLLEFKDFSNLLFFSGAILCFMAGVLSSVTLFFDPLYLQIIKNQSPQLAGLTLFIIPVAVFVMAFIVDRLILHLNIINTVLLGLILACIASLLQIFFNFDSALIYIIIAFFCLGSVWAMGNTVSIIAAQKAVSENRKSLATGTIVTMFNIGGSIGLALAIVVYHSFSINILQRKKIDTVLEFQYLKELISNPSHSLQLTMNSSMRYLVHDIFMHGFKSVMWFLLILSCAAFLSVLIWKLKSPQKMIDVKAKNLL